jgi:patatin-related protein
MRASEGAKTSTEQSTAPKELRIALVCYGGVSLAVYIHGVTKELYKLVRASRQFDRDRDVGTIADDPATAFPQPPETEGIEYDTEPLYYAALKALHTNRTPIMAAIDVIAGTSAGGINGVFLARALAHGRSLNGLRSLWLRDGDLEGLLNGHWLVPAPRKAKMMSKMAVALGRIAEKDNRSDAPLNGGLMSQLLYGALKSMAPVTPTLVLPAGSLDLFVPTTDVYGYSTAIPTGVGGVSHTDRSFQQLLSFHYDPRATATRDSDNFADDSVAALAFAARATSSFPGAFPSVSLGTFAAAVNEMHPGAVQDVGPIASRLFYKGEYESEPADAWYMDGGVLDNGPFDHVIHAIARKRASGPVARELIYIEPDPGGPPTAEIHHHQPSWLKVIMAARMTIPWHASLIDTLNELRDMNSSIDEIGALTRSQMTHVTEEMGKIEVDTRTDYAAMIAKGPQIRGRAMELAGLGYGSYCQLRADAVAAEIAGALASKLGFPPRSNKSSFVVSVITSWLRRKKEWNATDHTTLEAELGTVDTPLRLRRANFVLQGINDLLAADGLPAGRLHQLAALKSACWDLIEKLQGFVDDATSNSAVLGQAKVLMGTDALDDGIATSDPAAFAAANTDALNELFNAYRDNLKTEGSSQTLWNTFKTSTEGWTAGSDIELASRYLLFPIWDATIFPIIALARLPQLSPIHVQRFSPLDAVTLNPPEQPGFGSHKLRGTAIDHFGGFFEEAWRENDYLWGRLDGVDLIFGLLTAHGPGADLTEEAKAAFHAVLDSETEALRNIQGDIVTIRDRI